MVFLNQDVIRRIKVNLEKIKEEVSGMIGVDEKECNTKYKEIPEVVKTLRKIGKKDNLTEYNKREILQKIPYIIDHTLLKAFAGQKDLKKLCEEALKYKFASVCVNSANVKVAKNLLEGSGVRVASAVGFPLGAISMKAKIFEATYAIEDGADELDVVLNIAKIKDAEYSYVYNELNEITSLNENIIVKVIIENCYLTDEEKVKASYIVKLSGSHFVKTSTGFGTSGAKTQDIKLMRNTIGEDMGIKAAGGIRNFDILFDMVIAGATRIGASSSVNIISG